MSFKQLLKKGTLGDLRERVSPDREPSASGSMPAGDQSAAASTQSTRVLYVTGDARESRIVSGAFTHSHPHLDFDFSVELARVRAHLSSGRQHDVLMVGWSVPGEEAFSLIGYARDHGSGIPIVAAAEQSLELYRQAGADECVRKGGSFLSRLPIAIEDAIRKRPAPAVAAAASTAPAVRTFSPGVTTLRVAYAGDLEQLRAAVDGLEPPVECVSLADALRNFDLQPSSAPVEIVLIEHGDKASVAIADVRARNLEVALVLLVESADERTAFETFGASLDDYIAKTSDWTSRLQLRLTAARTRYQQTRELMSLRLKEARLRSLVEKLPASIVRLSADGNVLATNDRAVTLLGAGSAAHILKKSFDTMVRDEDREAWTEFVVRVCAGETRSTEVTITTLDGIERVIEAAAVPSPAEFGRSPSLLMVLRDVTDRKRLETAVEYATELAAEPPPELETDTDLDFLPEAPVNEPVISAPARVPIEARRPLRELEADLHRISGTARATFQELGSLLRDAESQHDAALTRQADEYAKLKAIELEHFQFYEAFVQAASQGIFRATPEGRLLSLNPAMAAVLGYDSPAAVLAATASLAVMMDGAVWNEAVTRWRGQGSDPLDTPWLDHNRQPLTLRLHGRLIEGLHGDGECVEVVAENVTGQRLLETQLRRARKWEDVARITSGIAADLTHVVTAASESQDMESMQQATSKAVALSRQLVAFGRRQARNLTPVDLNAVVSQMEDVLRRLIDEHIELSFAANPSLPSVLAAPPPIEEALVSLTVTAVDVLPAGGRIHIELASVSIDGENGAQHEGIEPGSYGVISLTATGWGIDDRTRERLLAGQTRAEDVGGGFSLAVRAVGQAGGGLRLDSVSGDSLTFRIYVPQLTRGVEAGL